MQRFTRKKRAGWQMPKHVNCCTLPCSDDNTHEHAGWVSRGKCHTTVLLLAVRTLHDFYRRIGRNTSICIAFNKNELKYTSQRGWCAEVNKDGEEGISKENRRGVQNPQYRITTDPVLWCTTRRRGSVPNKTHTPLRVRTVVWRRSKSKTGRVVLPIFLPFSLLLLFHRAWLLPAGNISIGSVGCLPAA